MLILYLCFTINYILIVYGTKLIYRKELTVSYYTYKIKFKFFIETHHFQQLQPGIDNKCR